MKAYIFFDISFFLIEFEPFLGTDIRKYQESFEDWFYIETSENMDEITTITYKPRKMCWGINEILEWMKRADLNSNPRVLEEHVFGDKYDKNIPAMCF